MEVSNKGVEGKFINRNMFFIIDKLSRFCH